MHLPVSVSGAPVIFGYSEWLGPQVQSDHWNLVHEAYGLHAVRQTPNHKMVIDYKLHEILDRVLGAPDKEVLKQTCGDQPAHLCYVEGRFGQQLVHEKRVSVAIAVAGNTKTRERLANLILTWIRIDARGEGIR